MVVGNILDRNIVREAVSKAEVVFHFAAMADIQEARDNPVEAANFNVLGTMYVLDACREFRIKRFIYASTIYVYSDHGSFYRSSKQACELFIENYQQEYQLDFTILRYGSLYGPRANHFNFIKNCIQMALLEGVIIRKGDGEEVRDYINILDAAKATVQALSNDYKNSYLMITGAQTMKVKELLSMIKEIMNDTIEVKYNYDTFEGHYKITPYSFKPKVALKITPKDYHDLGQGILDSIYEIYQNLIDAGLQPKTVAGIKKT
jgi:UDP-glucose 4-epimerase